MNVFDRIARGGVVRIRTLEETKLAARWARSEGFSRRGALRGGSAARRSRLGAGRPAVCFTFEPLLPYLQVRVLCVANRDRDNMQWRGQYCTCVRCSGPIATSM